MLEIAKTEKVENKTTNGSWVARSLIFSLQCAAPTLFLFVLLEVWVTTVRNEKPHFPNHAIIGAAVGVLFLFGLLFVAEALETAYSILRDKHEDEFGTPYKDLFRDMKANEEHIYEAREWLVVGIITVIALISEFKHIWLPVPPRWIPQSLAWRPGCLDWVDWRVPPNKVFALMFVSFPAIWIAQGPAKAWAKQYPLHALSKASLFWKVFIKWPGKLLGFMYLNKLSVAVAGVVKKVSHPSKNARLQPSYEGFFMTALHRYGVGLHELSVTVKVNDDGSCSVLERLVVYLARYTRRGFSRYLYSGAPLRQNRSFKVAGAPCDLVYEKYADIASQASKALQLLGDPAYHQKFCKLGYEEFKKPETQTECNGLRFVVTPHYELPVEDQAYVIACEYSAEWGEDAYKKRDDETDSYEMIFEYPCGKYELRIKAPENMRFVEVQAVAEFKNDAHKGETERLKDAQLDREDTTALHSVLWFPLLGVKYKYSWRIYKESKTPLGPPPPPSLPLNDNLIPSPPLVTSSISPPG